MIKTPCVTPSRALTRALYNPYGTWDHVASVRSGLPGGLGLIPPKYIILYTVCGLCSKLLAQQLLRGQICKSYVLRSLLYVNRAYFGQLGAGNFLRRGQRSGEAFVKGAHWLNEATSTGEAAQDWGSNHKAMKTHSAHVPHAWSVTCGKPAGHGALTGALRGAIIGLFLYIGGPLYGCACNTSILEPPDFGRLLCTVIVFWDAKSILNVAGSTILRIDGSSHMQSRTLKPARPRRRTRPLDRDLKQCTKLLKEQMNPQIGALCHILV